MSDPDIKRDILSKLKPINLILLNIYEVLWYPSLTLTVDKCIS